MNRFIVALCLGIVLTFSLPKPIAKADTPIKPPVDNRINQLQNFFVAHKCPSPYYINDYLKYADEYKVDYRLLPSISILESGCGRHDCYHTNNWWGWGSCQGIKFASISDGIKSVDEALANNHYYAGKSDYQKMRAYNPNPAYATKIINLENSIK